MFLYGECCAGVGKVFMRNGITKDETLGWALSIWGGWHLISGIISLAITLPIIGILEKANVRKIKGAG